MSTERDIFFLAHPTSYNREQLDEIYTKYHRIDLIKWDPEPEAAFFDFVDQRVISLDQLNSNFNKYSPMALQKLQFQLQIALSRWKYAPEFEILLNRINDRIQMDLKSLIEARIPNHNHILTWYHDAQTNRFIEYWISDEDEESSFRGLGYKNRKEAIDNLLTALDGNHPKTQILCDFIANSMYYDRELFNPISCDLYNCDNQRHYLRYFRNNKIELQYISTHDEHGFKIHKNRLYSLIDALAILKETNLYIFVKDLKDDKKQKILLAHSFTLDKNNRMVNLLYNGEHGHYNTLVLTKKYEFQHNARIMEDEYRAQLITYINQKFGYNIQEDILRFLSCFHEKNLGILSFEEACHYTYNYFNSLEDIKIKTFGLCRLTLCKDYVPEKSYNFYTNLIDNLDLLAKQCNSDKEKCYIYVFKSKILIKIEAYKEAYDILNLMGSQIRTFIPTYKVDIAILILRHQLIPEKMFISQAKDLAYSILADLSKNNTNNNDNDNDNDNGLLNIDDLNCRKIRELTVEFGVKDEYVTNKRSRSEELLCNKDNKRVKIEIETLDKEHADCKNLLYLAKTETNREKSIFLYNELLNCAIKYDLKTYQAEAHIGIANNYKDSSTHYKNALCLGEQLENKEIQAKAYVGLGNNKSGNSVEYYTNALKLSQEIGNVYLQIKANLGIAKNKSGSTAKNHYNKAILLAQDFGEKDILCRCYILYSNFLKYEKDYKDATFHLNKAKEIGISRYMNEISMKLDLILKRHH